MTAGAPSGRSTPEQVASSLAEMRDVCVFIASAGRDAFLATNPQAAVNRLAAERVVINVQSAIDDLPDAFIEAHSDLPFHLLRGMRNRLAHQYDDIDPALVWTSIASELPDFMTSIIERVSRTT